MLRRTADIRNQVLGRIADQCSGLDTSDLPMDCQQFLRLYYKNVSVEDLKERDPADLCGAALSHLRLATTRKPGSPKLRVYNPSSEEHGWSSTHTIVQVVNDDMPFLVDSVGMALNREGLAIHLTVHPIMGAKRDGRGRLKQVLTPGKGDDDCAKESFLYFEVDRSAGQARFAQLEKLIGSVLSDVRAAIEDWPSMRDCCLGICRELDESPPPLDPSEISESRALLDWMADDHFTFLGYRQYKLGSPEHEYALNPVEGTGLGILRDERTRSPSDGGVILPKDIRRQALSKELLIITKANSLATVHRRGYLDYIGVKTFVEGKPVGEKRFLGLFTSVAYSRRPRNIPLLRLKVQQVMQRSGLPLNSHGAKALMHILDTFPPRRAVSELCRRPRSNDERYLPSSGAATGEAFHTQRRFQTFLLLPHFRPAG